MSLTDCIFVLLITNDSGRSGMTILTANLTV